MRLVNARDPTAVHEPRDPTKIDRRCIQKLGRSVESQGDEECRTTLSMTLDTHSTKQPCVRGEGSHATWNEN